jgi:hypothetical protein
MKSSSCGTTLASATKNGFELTTSQDLNGTSTGTELRQIAPHHDCVFLVQPFLGDRRRGDAHSGLARRLAPAAAVIADAVLLPVCVIGVTRPERILDLRVILAASIDVADKKPDRRAGGPAFEHAGEDFDHVVLPPLCHVARSSRLAAVEIALNIGFSRARARADSRRPRSRSQARDSRRTRSRKIIYRGCCPTCAACLRSQ